MLLYAKKFGRLKEKGGIMKKFFYILLFCFFTFKPAFAFDFLNKMEDKYQQDVDIVRMKHFDYYSNLLNRYFEKTHKYPFQDKAVQSGAPVYVFIMNDTQRSRFRDTNPNAHTEEKQENLFKEIETKLGIKIVPKYDPQNFTGSDHRPVMYIYMVTKDEVFFAVHVYDPNKFTKKVANHYYKIELSNEDDNKYKFYTYKTLQADPDYQRLITQEPTKKEYFNKRAKGEI